MVQICGFKLIGVLQVVENPSRIRLLRSRPRLPVSRSPPLPSSHATTAASVTQQAAPVSQACARVKHAVRAGLPFPPIVTFPEPSMQSVPAAPVLGQRDG